MILTSARGGAVLQRPSGASAAGARFRASITGPAINLAPPSGPAAGLPQPLVQPGGLLGDAAVGAERRAGALGRPGRARAERTLRQGQPAPFPAVWSGASMPRSPIANGSIAADEGRPHRDAERDAAAGQLCRPCQPRHGERDEAGDACGRTRRARCFEIPAGGLRIEGRVGTSRIPPGQITFDVFKGSQFDTAERAPIVPDVPAGDAVLLPEGTYYIISNYGDANSVVRSDIRVQVGKLTDVTVQHRAAVITLKLVGDRGGEALANTAWSVITPGGDVIKESIGAFPRVVLAEGDYRVIARNEGKMFERDFNVVTGVDGEIEVLAR